MASQADTADATSGSKLPYVVQPTMVPKILAKIKEAKAPDRFTVDFLQTKLGFKGGNCRRFIPLAKKLGLLESDGRPTDRYKKLRNPATAKFAVADAVRSAYKELFERNEYAQNLKKEDFKGLVLEITGLAASSEVVARVCQTFEVLKGLADFEAHAEAPKVSEEAEAAPREADGETGGHESEAHRLKLGLSYTFNLVLPKTDDPAVFNAIFRSLRDNLLRS